MLCLALAEEERRGGGGGGGVVRQGQGRSGRGMSDERGRYLLLLRRLDGQLPSHLVRSRFPCSSDSCSRHSAPSPPLPSPSFRFPLSAALPAFPSCWSSPKSDSPWVPSPSAGVLRFRWRRYFCKWLATFSRVKPSTFINCASHMLEKSGMVTKGVEQPSGKHVLHQCRITSIQSFFLLPRQPTTVPPAYLSTSLCMLMGLHLWV